MLWGVSEGRESLQLVHVHVLTCRRGHEMRMIALVIVFSLFISGYL